MVKQQLLVFAITEIISFQEKLYLEHIVFSTMPLYPSPAL
jgi:hypothetical protein